MIKAIIKNAKYKYGTTLCSVIVTLVMLIKIEGFDALDAVRVFLGGYPLRRTVLILAFVLCITLIQYINVDPIMCLLKSNTYFLVRYEKRKMLLYRLFKNIFSLNALFIGFVFIAYGISVMICGLKFSWNDGLEILELSFRGFLMCICCSLIQVISMIRLYEMNTFTIMMAISVLSAFISRIDIGIFRIFTIFPMQMPKKDLCLNLIICFLYIIVGIFFCNSLYQRKGAE